MQSAQAAGLSAESNQIDDQLQRLIGFLQNKNRLLIYQHPGKGIEMKLKQVNSDNETIKTESTGTDLAATARTIRIPAVPEEETVPVSAIIY